MSLVVVGLSHRSAPVEVLERVAASTADADKVLGELLEREHVEEALLLCTCNRVEVYAVVATFHGGLADITDILARQCAIALEELTGHLYVHYAAAGVEHLFSVAAGLDSMVVGEQQILGQLRAAYTGAEQAGTIGRLLHEVVQQALRVGKRVHTETGIDAAGASVVSEALAATAAALAGAGEGAPGAGLDGAALDGTGLDGTGPPGAGLAGRRALVLGAGSLGGLAAAQLRRAGVAEIVVANRTRVSAARLAALCEAEGTPAQAAGLDGVAAVLTAVDVVICCTGASDAVLSVEQVADARGVDQATDARGHRRVPLVVCDLGLPRNVEPGVGELPGVTLLDLTTVARRLEQRPAASDAVSAAHHLVAQEVRAYLVTQRTLEVAPTVAALRRRAAEVVDAELMRLDGRLPGLDAAVREELARTVRRVVDKLLHAPTVRVKQLAETGGGAAYAEALRELFELDPRAAAAIAATVRSDPSRAG
ncbi:MAG: glutamyl-tRNA reductase [Pseudonocardiales bacterium]|nr:glutamyl-tRNA reductase [Pseudonocardiales bacterium]MBV9031942.1 glutamyl-tRNA reductase [Pseudonocardiales bacterium]MBW0010392.1 glutamyl-tRNA reductase [Pseudonocardiales bacterium]